MLRREKNQESYLDRNCFDYSYTGCQLASVGEREIEGYVKKALSIPASEKLTSITKKMFDAKDSTWDIARAKTTVHGYLAILDGYLDKLLDANQLAIDQENKIKALLPRSVIFGSLCVAGSMLFPKTEVEICDISMSMQQVIMSATIGAALLSQWYTDFWHVDLTVLKDSPSFTEAIISGIPLVNRGYEWSTAVMRKLFQDGYYDRLEKEIDDQRTYIFTHLNAYYNTMIKLIALVAPDELNNLSVLHFEDRSKYNTLLLSLKKIISVRQENLAKNNRELDECYMKYAQNIFTGQLPSINDLLPNMRAPTEKYNRMGNSGLQFFERNIAQAKAEANSISLLQYLTEKSAYRM